MNKKKFGLDPQVIEKLNLIFRQYPAIEKVLIYGSRAKGNYREGSDIDLCLVGNQITTADLLKIENEIEDLLLSYKVDLSIRSKTENAEFLSHIDRVGIEFL